MTDPAPTGVPDRAQLPAADAADRPQPAEAAGHAQRPAGIADRPQPPAADAADRAQRPAADAADRPQPPAAEPPMRDLVLDSLGGWRGFLDAGLPSLCFIVANAIGGLTPAIWAGGVAGAAVFLLRVLRKEKIQQAVSGLFALALCIFIARQTGESRDFFAFGILRSGAFALVLLGSLVLRRPLIGYAWSFFSPVERWRDDPRLLRVFNWLTAIWAGGFALRFVLEGVFYLADSTTALGAMRIALGYPLTFVMLLVTYLIASKATGQERRIRLPGRFGR
ncbi:DUF3159 domain-containing protein [Cumulibacter manganitolerans]|uniref:DUF3159 domain-containing protein n=1 Tax=Cumulibacter manganitolerans TaxID=1884992 RepID=UPI0012964E84|nr:DUF3159 domain-containing protein [Cumulibacter manganitolerans]